MRAWARRRILKAGKSGGRAENLHPNSALFRSAHVVADANRRRVRNVSRRKGLRRKHHSHESVRRFRFVATEICRDRGCGHLDCPFKEGQRTLAYSSELRFQPPFPKSRMRKSECISRCPRSVILIASLVDTNRLLFYRRFPR